MYEQVKYRLYIGKYSPETLPLSRLGQYASAFSRLLSTGAEVKFGGLEEGSTTVVAAVEAEHAYAVAEKVKAESENSSRTSPISEINELLKQDGTFGHISNPRGENIINFRGAKEPEILEYPSFREDTILDGQLVRIGGTDETVHAKIVDGELSYGMSMNRELAKSLAPFLFGSKLRFHGSARFKRDKSGQWSILQFDLSHFEELDDGTLSDDIEQLRKLNVAGLKGREAFRLIGLDGDEESLI